MKQVRTRFIVAFMLLVASVGLAQTKKAAQPASSAPDKAHLQKIWDAWSTLTRRMRRNFTRRGRTRFSISLR